MRIYFAKLKKVWVLLQGVLLYSPATAILLMKLPMLPHFKFTVLQQRNG